MRSAGRRRQIRWFAGVCLVLGAGAVGLRAGDPLGIASGGRTGTVVVVSPEAGLPEVTEAAGERQRGRDPGGRRNAEWLAAVDLVTYVERMTGAAPPLVFTRDGIDAALAGPTPVILVGEEALAARPGWAARVRAGAKPDPVLRADVIGLHRDGNRVFVAGNHDEAHYYAVSALLHHWGCRWYMPTDFGECIPERPELTLGELDLVHAPPFEVRRYWLSWNASDDGAAAFRRRNFMNHDLVVPSGHALDAYTRELVPEGGTMFEVPVSEEATIRHVAAKTADAWIRGDDFSLGMEDGIYQSDSPRDRELKGLQYDKYFLQPSMTDCFMTLYNGVARTLGERHPGSRSKIGFLAYSNMTLPPVRVTRAEPPLVCYLAPIDIDPIHGMDNPRSPPRREYRDMVYGWSRVMDGRVVIYDYDQGMMVWRDLPNPSIQMLEQDFAHYRKAGVLGVDTESRGAIGTTFLNLHCRAQLLWDPSRKVKDMLAEFYPAFYGPAAGPMAAYWSAILNAWTTTLVTEHEHFVIPAIYTPELISTLRRHLQDAEAAMASRRRDAAPSDRDRKFLERLDFTRHSFAIIEAYAAMVAAAATRGDYAEAVRFGEQGLAAREALTAMNNTFTTYQRRHPKPGAGPGGMPEEGPAWWPGEVQQYRDLQTLVDGTRGRLVARLPLDWAFRRDPAGRGLDDGWGLRAPDLAYWHRQGATMTPEARKDHPPDQWEMVRTDLYLQAQGVRSPDSQSYSGEGWYTTEMELSADQVGAPIRLMFPGLFNECRLYVNGREVAHRAGYKPLWWHNDYRFEWDVDLTGRLHPGRQRITLHLRIPNHFGGLFRRPFLYSPLTDAGKPAPR